MSKQRTDDSARVWRISGLTQGGMAKPPARPNSQASTGTGEKNPCSPEHGQNSQPYPVDQFSAEYADK